MPGYWTSADLALIVKELVEPLNKIWKTRSYSKTKKAKLFAEAQHAFVSKHSDEFARRSRMQNFDVAFEVKKRLATSDCIERDENGDPIRRGAKRAKRKNNKPEKKRYKMKNTLQIALGRMATRPFIKYENFDVAKFSDYGRKKYDKKGDGGGEERMGQTKKRNKKKKKKRRRRDETSE